MRNSDSIQMPLTQAGGQRMVWQQVEADGSPVLLAETHGLTVIDAEMPAVPIAEGQTGGRA